MVARKTPAKDETAKAVEPTAEDRIARMETLMQEMASGQELLEARLRQSEGEKEQLMELVANAEAKAREREESGIPMQPKVDLLYDPYDVQNPLAIVKDIPPSEGYPLGQKLAWKDPQYRDNDRGWRGWIPIRFEDDIDLSEYIPDPPQRFMGEAEMDGYVRRAGLVLARLDMRLWEARNQRREQKSLEARGLANPADPVNFDRSGIQITDEGSHSEEKPSFGKTPEPMGEHSHRLNLPSPDYQED